MHQEDTIRDLEISLSEIDSSEGSIPDFSLFQIHLKAKSFLYNQVGQLALAFGLSFDQKTSVD